jgi:hypothetical protein
MADDRMQKDDLQKNMGAGEKDKNYQQQSPGKGQQDKQAGQHAGGQQGSGQFGGQKGTRNMDDKDEDLGTSGTGSQHRGGQNR